MKESELHYLEIPTPFSTFYIIVRQSDSEEANHESVVASGFGTLSHLKELLTPLYAQLPLTAYTKQHPYQDIIEKYFSGDTSLLKNIPLLTIGTPFQRRVWKKISSIPVGTAISYAALAQAIGQPKAVRAVGSACRANSHLLLIPCHRVIKSDGRAGNYRFGEKLKVQLQTYEQSLKEVGRATNYS